MAKDESDAHTLNFFSYFLLVCYKNLLYLCDIELKEIQNVIYAMKKEFGKWLMDIAKYMTTALVLSSVFGEMDSPIILGIVVAGAMITLIIGLLLVKENKKKEEK
jgi:hypothetical protein